VVFCVRRCFFLGACPPFFFPTCFLCDSGTDFFSVSFWRLPLSLFFFAKAFSGMRVFFARFQHPCIFPRGGKNWVVFFPATLNSLTLIPNKERVLLPWLFPSMASACGFSGSLWLFCPGSDAHGLVMKSPTHTDLFPPWYTGAPPPPPPTHQVVLFPGEFPFLFFF